MPQGTPRFCFATRSMRGKTPDTIPSANYNPVAEAEAILASEALQVAA